MIAKADVKKLIEKWRRDADEEEQRIKALPAHASVIASLFDGRVRQRRSCANDLEAALQSPSVAPVEHDWMDRDDPRMERWPSLRAKMHYRMCYRCAVIERRDGKNKPCRGVMPEITLRDSVAPVEGERQEQRVRFRNAQTGDVFYSMADVEREYIPSGAYELEIEGLASSASKPQGVIDHYFKTGDVLTIGGKVSPTWTAAVPAPETPNVAGNTIDVQLACASGRHSYWYPSNRQGRCRYCDAPEKTSPAPSETQE